MPRERRIELALGGPRFIIVDVEAGADALVVHRLDERGFVDDLAARGVEQDRAGLEMAEQLRVDHALRIGGRRYVERNDVAVAHQLVQVVLLLHADGLQPTGGFLVTAGLAHDMDVHAERRGPFRECEANTAQAHDADVAAHDALGLRVLLLVPLTLTQLDHVVRDVAVDRQQQAEGQFGDGDRVLARHVADRDVLLGRGLFVDGIGAGAGADDQFQAVGGLDGRARDLRAAHDEHFGAGDVRRQVLGGQIGLEIAVVALGFEVSQVCLLKLVCEEDLHGHSFGARMCGVRAGRTGRWASRGRMHAATGRRGRDRADDYVTRRKIATRRCRRPAAAGDAQGA